MKKLHKSHRLLVLACLSYALSANAFSQSKTVLDYCSIVRSPSSYAGKDVHFRAYLTYSTVSRVDGGDSFFFSPQCNSGDYFTTVEFSNPVSTSFFEKLDLGKEFVLEAEVVGKFDSSFPALFGHLSWALHELTIINLISVKDVSRTQANIKPNYDAETPIRNDGRAISALTSEIVSGFMGTGSITLERYFSSNLIVIGFEQKPITISEAVEAIRLFLLTDNNTTSFVSNPSVERHEKDVIATGIFGVRSQNGLDKKSVGYECAFRRSGDGLDPVKIVFTKK
jgi:hypothetical protein